MYFVIFTVDNYHSGSGHYARMKPVAQYLESCGHSASFFFIDKEEGYMRGAPDVFIIDADTVEYQSKSLSICSKYRVPIFIVNAKIEMSSPYVTSGAIIAPFHNITLQVPNCFVDPCFMRAKKHVIGDAIFLNQGASDPWGVMIRIVAALNAIYQKRDIPLIKCVAGKNVSRSVKAFMKVGLFPMVDPYIDIAPAPLSEMISSCRLAITAPGQMYSELSVMGIPSLIIGHHKIHDEIGKDLHYKGLAIYLGCGRDMKDEELIERLETWAVTKYRLGTTNQICMDNMANKAKEEAMKFGPEQLVEQILNGIWSLDKIKE